MDFEERIQQLENQVSAIKKRNDRVEMDKAWETSWARTFAVTGITYIIATGVFLFLKSNRPWFDALVPTIGFFLSVQSLPYIKKIWIKYKQK